MNEIQF